MNDKQYNTDRLVNRIRAMEMHIHRTYNIPHSELSNMYRLTDDNISYKKYFLFLARFIEKKKILKELLK